MSKSIGKEISQRLKKFNQQLESMESLEELPKILTVRKVKLNLRPQTFTSEGVKSIREVKRKPNRASGVFGSLAIHSPGLGTGEESS